MMQNYDFENRQDEDGNPAGGFFHATGIEIEWQDGPLGRVGTDERAEPNGAFVETVIEAARQRLYAYQASKFACAENEDAINHLTMALVALNDRTAKREARGVEGTHEA